MKKPTIENSQRTFFNAEDGIVQRIANIITNTAQTIEKAPGRRLEFLACVMYIICHLIITMMHEPWYDESVAWNIARSASLKEILFSIPHYEGHPPLWHLILFPFAKLGTPYELSLNLIALFFASTACGLIVFKAPFPRIIRLLLPFTYFFFYQYGVVSRPYCMMMLACILVAMAYKTRDKRPIRYTLTLMFLCLTSAYGIVLAGGLAMVWVWEIWKLQKLIPFIKGLPHDKRFWCLLTLLVFALLLIAEIIPSDDTYATVQAENPPSNNFIFCLCYMLFALPIEASFSSIYISADVIKFVEIFPPLLFTTSLLGLLFWIIVFSWGKTKKMILPLVVPYLLFSIFAASVYFYRHHIGIALLFLVFWFWITCEHEEVVPIVHLGIDKISLKNILLITGTIAMGVSLYWSISSSIQDILFSYAPGKEDAQFISEHNLDQYDIMVAWNVYEDDLENLDMDINHCRLADNVVPYFNRNIFMNFNNGRDDKNYTTHKVASKDYTEKCINIWKDKLPEVCFMSPYLEAIYGENVSLEEYYTLVFAPRHNMVWKGVPDFSQSQIHIRTDLLEDFGLSAIE